MHLAGPLYSDSPESRYSKLSAPRRELEDFDLFYEELDSVLANASVPVSWIALALLVTGSGHLSDWPTAHGVR